MRIISAVTVTAAHKLKRIIDQLLPPRIAGNFPANCRLTHICVRLAFCPVCFHQMNAAVCPDIALHALRGYLDPVIVTHLQDVIDNAGLRHRNNRRCLILFCINRNTASVHGCHHFALHPVHGACKGSLMAGYCKSGAHNEQSQLFPGFIKIHLKIPLLPNLLYSVKIR